MSPAISIIVPVFNVEAFLEDCINSILAQSFENFELILVNDGSTDLSGEICNEFSRIDKRVKVIHKEYGGVSSARNVGVQLAQGEYIGFVDSDDRIDKEMYKELYQLCNDTSSDISICQLGREINGKLVNSHEEKYSLEMDHVEALRQLFKGNLYRFSLCNKLFKKNCFENVQFPEGRIHEDLATTYKLFVNSRKAIFTNYIGYIYVKRENSILTSLFNERRLDAFLGWDEILRFVHERYPNLSNVVICTFAFGTVDNIHYILKQVEHKKDKGNYLKNIQPLVRKYFSKILHNKYLSLKYKLTLSMLIVNRNLLIYLDNLK
jgi:glycosyltransferase involved in cell wall biosynthesis